MGNHHNNHNHHGHAYGGTMLGELICHFPYAVFSVAFGLALLSFVSFVSFGSTDPVLARKGANMLFHSFHFMHIVFAATGTMITFLRFSKNVLKACLVGIISPSLFCMLSDAVMPYVGGTMLGVPMKLHICFYSELANVLPFLLIGIINGFVMSRHQHERQGFYSVFSHAIHILVSSLASALYLVSHGFTNWYAQIGNVFLLLIVAVVIPCTLSDVVVPMIFARVGQKDEKH